jgi:PAS domain S-box-containing protein
MTATPDLSSEHDPDAYGEIDLCRAYQQAIDVNIISSITDTNGTITHVNKKFCEISKYNWHELIGQNHRIVNSGYHSPEFFADMWRTIKSGEVWHGEVRNRAKDHSIYWVETVIIPIRSASGVTNNYLSLRLPITERKNAEMERAQYTLRLQEMLRMTSHRVRAPLATCLGIMNMMAEQPDMPEEEEKKLFGHLRESALHLDQFTHELTTFLTELQKKYEGIAPET